MVACLRTWINKGLDRISGVGPPPVELFSRRPDWLEAAATIGAALAKWPACRVEYPGLGHATPKTAGF
jgi:hypothetical protein